MKLTREHLKRLIQEELSSLQENEPLAQKESPEPSPEDVKKFFLDLSQNLSKFSGVNPDEWGLLQLIMDDLLTVAASRDLGGVQGALAQIRGKLQAQLGIKPKED
jgi:hypothetical protein